MDNIGLHYYVQGELTKAGSMNVEDRLLHYLIAYVLVKRNTNHPQPIGIIINWHVEILKVMSGITSYLSRLMAYEIFISRVVEHVGIDITLT
ncbi:hypothetical protein Lal_00026740 [Lupinus albus]|nr:hypothetical protein Lal_00026740 [Lupinus albus]